MQPLADGIKLYAKEYIIPRHSNPYLFAAGPLYILFHSFVLWGCCVGSWCCGVYYF